MTLPTDRDLILSTRRGDVKAFSDLVRRYQVSAFNVCYRLLGERREAEDMTQEAFVRAYQRLDTFDADRPFGPWLRRVAANLCFNRIKARRTSEVELEDERDADPRANRPEARYERQERADRVRAAVIALPQDYRLVIELRHFHEMSYEEIAQTLRIPLSKVKSDLFRARKMLAEGLKDVAPF